MSEPNPTPKFSKLKFIKTTIQKVTNPKPDTLLEDTTPTAPKPEDKFNLLIPAIYFLYGLIIYSIIKALTNG